MLEFRASGLIEFGDVQGVFLLLEGGFGGAGIETESAGLGHRLPFTLFVSAIHKRQHLQRCGPTADDPYGLALKFTVEPLLHFLDASGETQLPIVAEARGKNEDHALRQDFTDILALPTAARSAAQQRPLDLSLTFQPKWNNIAGKQIANLCAYPCARHILNPSRSNPPYEIACKKLYQKGAVSGWKLFP